MAKEKQKNKQKQKGKGRGKKERVEGPCHHRHFPERQRISAFGLPRKPAGKDMRSLLYLAAQHPKTFPECYVDVPVPTEPLQKVPVRPSQCVLRTAWRCCRTPRVHVPTTTRSIWSISSECPQLPCVAQSPFPRCCSAPEATHPPHSPSSMCWIHTPGRRMLSALD